MTAPILDDNERETVITWTDADDGRAAIYTCHPPMMRLLQKHPHADLIAEHRSERGELTGVEYELPVACLAIFTRPRPSTWERMLRTGPRRRSPREASRRLPRGHFLEGVPNAQVDLVNDGPRGGRP